MIQTETITERRAKSNSATPAKQGTMSLTLPGPPSWVPNISWKPQTYSILLPSKSRPNSSDREATSTYEHENTFDRDMPRPGIDLTVDLNSLSAGSSPTPTARPPPRPAAPEWDWDIEHEDRRREQKADSVLHGSQPFQVDRRVLKDVVREKMGVEVGRILFLSAGTFHKAYLVTLVDATQLVARVARRFMPRLKTESEVATMQYLREHTNVPVPRVFHYDSNPYNRLGGEYILMSKAPGIPLSKVYHSMPHAELLQLLSNLAGIVIPLFAHRFSHLGSLYFGPRPSAGSGVSSSAVTPKATQLHYAAFPFSPTLSMSSMSSRADTPRPTAKTPKPLPAPQEYHVGPIISWPFFGTNRGELTPTEIDRGPWTSARDYFASCSEREIAGVVRENEGKSAPHRLHLDPDEIHSSRHHHLNAVPGDESDESDEWDLEESEEEWEGPGDAMYRDYRRMQRSTFLVAHMTQRVECVKKEMARWARMMDRLLVLTHTDSVEEFGLDCHDLSLENVFVDENDHSKISCIIDWESTTTRPLWACAHLPAFLQSSAFVAKLFRDAVSKLATPTPSQLPLKSAKSANVDLASLAREWLHYESAGVRLRMAHRFVEWDGWEEGLIDSILGPEEHDDEWFRDLEADSKVFNGASPPLPQSNDSEDGHAIALLTASIKRRKPSSKLPFVKEKEKEQMLNVTGDICGGRGGELGRRLEAWIVNGTDGPAVKRRWNDEDDQEYDAEAEA